MYLEKIETRHAGRLLWVVLFLVLASCTAAPVTPPPPRESGKEPERVERQQLEPPPQTPIVAKPPTQTAVARTSDPINDNPQQLFGLDAHNVAALLGPASFVRRDGPAEVWQYRAEACVLDVYLYKEVRGLIVAHIDLRKRLKATQPPRHCFAALLSEQQ